MNEEKLKQVLNKIGQAEVPPNIALIAEQTSQNFNAALKIIQPQRQSTFFAGFWLIAAAAVIVLAFAIGRLSKTIPPASTAPVATAYASAISASPAVGKNPESFWRQKMLAAMQPRPYAQTQFDQTRLLNAYKQSLKEKHND